MRKCADPKYALGCRKLKFDISLIIIDAQMCLHFHAQMCLLQKCLADADKNVFV